MLMQRILFTSFDQVGEQGAAVQHRFPEAVIQDRENGCNPNQPFAALEPDVSVADFTDFRCKCVNVWFNDNAAAFPRSSSKSELQMAADD